MACNNCYPCNCDPCTEQGCPLQLDFSCVVYHKDNNEVSELDGLGATNGVTLEAVIEDLDERIKQLAFGNSDINLPFLRTNFSVTTLHQFALAVDQTLATVSGFLGNVALDPIASDGQYWYRTDTSELKIKLNGSVKTITTS